MKKLRAVLIALLAALPALGGTTPSAESPLARGNNEFALSLYHRLASNEKGNLFFSPYSLSSALAMTYAGARGETARRMARTLRFNETDGLLHQKFLALDDSLNAESGQGRFALSVANALWGQRGFGFREEFLSLTRRYYGAGLHELDFAKPQKAAATINAWVEKATRGKIENLVTPDLVLDARLVLTNAIYFKGSWESAFKKKQTREEAFHSGAAGAKVPLMRQTAHFGYLETPELQALELPYKGGRLAMLVLLPRSKEGLPKLESKLDAASLRRWLGRMQSREVEVFLPKFKLARSLQLGGTLGEMGMNDAFDPKRADFSGMDGKRDLFISKVIHKAFVDVNEEGTEAAAATAVVMVMAAAIPRPPVVFRADHPFVFFIRDQLTGSLLFAGRFVAPAD